jgi:hypothetical protein
VSWWPKAWVICAGETEHPVTSASQHRVRGRIPFVNNPRVRLVSSSLTTTEAVPSATRDETAAPQRAADEKRSGKLSGSGRLTRFRGHS